MSKYGIKIKNYQAGSVYEVMLGVRENYDSTDAMFTNNLFSDYIKDNGLNVYKEKSTRDIICLEFDYGSRDYEQEYDHLKKLLSKCKTELKKAEDSKDKTLIEKKSKKLSNVSNLLENCTLNKDKFERCSSSEIRRKFYNNGLEIRYPKKYDKVTKLPTEYEIIKYRMLYRTPGKAKKGSCMFIREELYEKAHNFLWMGLELPEENAPIVEIGAYSSLATSTIEGKVQIKPEEILIVKDVVSYFNTDIINIQTKTKEVDDQIIKYCTATKEKDYTLSNEMFDGQALIDESIFPSWADGYILLRHHFTKMAAFHTKIQKFFKDYFGDKYETAKVKDMWGNEVQVKNIKLITTNNAVKFIKFNISFEYWSKWVRANDCMFGIVKTAHKSKLGNVQRMSYQMVNSLNIDSMDNVMNTSVEYVAKLKNDRETFFDYLRKNANFSNDFEPLLALCDQDPDFARSRYFKERKKEIIKSYVKDVKFGRLIQNGDNLVIVGSPYAMLLHSVGEDWSKDPTFEQEDGVIQCYTGRFNDGEYLAEFRSPFNSRNNLGYLHNHYHEYFEKYFNLGKQIIAVNMIGTDFQDRNNGLIYRVS